MSFTQYKRIDPGESYARQIMDPQGSLPYVSMVRDESKKSVADSFGLLQGETQAGWVSFGEDSVSEICYFSHIELPKLKQGQGIGLASYLLVIEAAHAEDKAFTCNNRVTEQARSIWERFVHAGVAEVIQPFVKLPRVRIDPTVYYSGVVRIDPRGSHG